MGCRSRMRRLPSVIRLAASRSIHDIRRVRNDSSCSGRSRRATVLGRNVRRARGGNSPDQRAAGDTPGTERRWKREQLKGREVGQVDFDEILPEYDFSRSGANKYALRYAAGSIVVVSTGCSGRISKCKGNQRGATRFSRNHPETPAATDSASAECRNLHRHFRYAHRPTYEGVSPVLRGLAKRVATVSVFLTVGFSCDDELEHMHLNRRGKGWGSGFGARDSLSAVGFRLTTRCY